MRKGASGLLCGRAVFYSRRSEFSGEGDADADDPFRPFEGPAPLPGLEIVAIRGDTEPGLSLVFDENDVTLVGVVARREKDDVSLEQTALDPGSIDSHALVIGLHNAEHFNQNIVFVGGNLLAALVMCGVALVVVHCFLNPRSSEVR